MMNLEPVPPIPAMNTAAVNFLDLLADPEAARKLMDDLVASHAKAAAANAEAKKLQVEVFEKQKAHDQDVHTFEQNRKAHSAFLADAGTKLDKRSLDLDAREKKLHGDIAEFEKRKAEYEADVAWLQADKASHEKAKNEHANNQAELANDRAKMDRWLAWHRQQPER